MPAVAAEVCGVHVPVRVVVGRRYMVGQCRSDGGLDALEGVYDEQAQGAVKT